MGDFGGRLSKEGVDVETAAQKDLLWTTKLRGINIRGKGIASSASFNFAHGLGFRPAFSGYIKDGTKYFSNYFISPLDGYSFENTAGYGDIYSDTTNIHCEHASANKLVYLCHLNPADDGANATSIASSKDLGIKMSNDGVEVLTGADGQMLIHSKFQGAMIILADTITVNVAAIDAVGATITKQSDFTDYTHGRSQANHFLVPDFYGAGLINLSTEPIGFTAPYVFEEHEVYIDATKIRYRITRVAEGSAIFGDAHEDAKTVDIKFFLTNIPLPT